MANDALSVPDATCRAQQDITNLAGALFRDRDSHAGLLSTVCHADEQTAIAAFSFELQDARRVD